MTTKKREPRRCAAKRISYETFFAEHDDLIADLFGTRDLKSWDNIKELASGKLASVSPPNRFMDAVNQLKGTAFPRILEAAGRENSPETFKETLLVLLLLMGIKAPAGVFTTMQELGSPGRPISAESQQIYARWVELGEPSPFKNDLAQAVYGASFTREDGIGRRKLRDKCRQALDRYLDRRIADLQKESARQDKELASLERQLAQLT